MPSVCVVCNNSKNSPCYKCEINRLKDKVDILENKLSYLNHQSSKILKLEKDYSFLFELSNRLKPLRYYGNMKNYQFLTITFDPNKFGHFNLREDEQNYIFHKLIKAINSQMITQLTGCFEYQKKTGTTHAHMIIRTNSTPDEIEFYFREYFTNDKRNKYAIKSYYLEQEKCEAYLQKESNEFYKYDLVNGLDDGLGLPDQDDQEDKVPLNINETRLNQLLAEYKKQQEIDAEKQYKKFESDMKKRYNITI